ncbi:DUF3300 domain-containing protein [Bradyrhizobium sp.]|uniref:DUF3300 domain-containing protein n=1 Tax=Bradyrhizobium sp. TaxID=376 RepID=UPI0025BA0ADA|nr:DUF3300 domain-containing protein [Bradyrhizobium sp.]MBV8923240.1 DUF3300 domain-containing protein [Bradyrhizobium sp.]
MLRCRKLIFALAIVLATPFVAAAQNTGAQPSASPSASPSPTDELLKPEQLEALVAPIALYPDALLANMLAASTYPLEVVEADRWAKENKKLKGDQLKTEAGKQGWDDSVKALVATPTVLDMMSDKLDWTKSLGDAMLAQQADLMDAIQRLRQKAQANNKLVSTKQQKVTVQTQENKQVIVIEPTDPDTMYVPYYDPAVVYGTWPYADYPPYYWGYPSYIGAGVVAAGLAFGAGYALARWGNYWGGGFNWGNRNVYVNHLTNNWTHNSIHRQGVRYNNANVAQRFGNNNLRAGSADRMDFRGRGGQQVLNPGKDRAGAGDRSGDRAGDRAGHRAGAGDRGRSDRAGAGDRGGDRATARDRSGGNRADRGGGDRPGSKQARSADRGRSGGGAGRGGGRDSAMRMQSGRAASSQAARGRQSFASMGGGGARASMGGGGARAMGGGGFRGGGGGGGFRGGGGGRRSDIALKHDVSLLGHLDNGLGYYRFSYIGSDTAYVGVIAQEVQVLRPDAVTRGHDGYLRVRYDRLGLKFRSFHEWLAGGARIPATRGRI